MWEYLFGDLGPWTWVVIGIALMGLELAAPGVFFVWLGLAAVLTGLLDWAFGLSWQAALLCFAVLAVVAVLAGRALTRHREEEDEGPAALNRRGHALVGKSLHARCADPRGLRAHPRRRFLLARRRPGRAGRSERPRGAPRWRDARRRGGLSAVSAPARTPGAP